MSRHEELARLIDQNTRADGIHATAIRGLELLRASEVTTPLYAPYEPAMCLIAQGEKQVMLGDRLLTYDPAKYLVISVDVAVVSQVTRASKAEPYLCVKLTLDPRALAAMMLETGLAPSRGDAPGPGLAVSEVTPEILDAVIRLVRLLDAPRDATALAPLVEREILYRLATGAQSDRLRQIALADSKLSQVSRAIKWIKTNFADTFSIETIAKEAGMSASSLHQHFKAVTAMSPLQYQKHLRLQEARRMILAESVGAATAGHRVGYQSPSQFSREYARQFGAPPLRDVARLKAAPGIALGA